MSKAHQLFLDLAHDAEINSGRTFLDCNAIEFYNDSRDSKPMQVVQYKIVDGALRVWLADNEWDDSTMKPKPLEAAATV